MTQGKKRKILLAVSGMSPQVITETFYALLNRRPDAWLPDEVHLITTSHGGEQAQLQLLQQQPDGPGYFHRLLKDFGITKDVFFDASTIHLISNESGEVLSDLRTPNDNEIAADFITKKICELTSDESTELHVSLAGGRKTMGFYIGYALSLFGRPQDRLSHVLVSPEFESLKDFYYPTPVSHVIRRTDFRSGKEISLDAKNAKIWLAEIPFVRLRDYVSEIDLLQGSSFHSIVDHVERMTLPPKLEVFDTESVVRVHGETIAFTPRDFAFYRWFISLCMDRAESILPPQKDDEVGDSDLAREFLKHFTAQKRELDDTDITEKALAKGMDRNYFDSVKARVNRGLAAVLGKKGAIPYQIQTLGKRPKSRFALTLSPDDIDIKD